MIVNIIDKILNFRFKFYQFRRLKNLQFNFDIMNNIMLLN